MICIKSILKAAEQPNSRVFSIAHQIHILLFLIERCMYSVHLLYPLFLSHIFLSHLRSLATSLLYLFLFFFSLLLFLASLSLSHAFCSRFITPRFNFHCRKIREQLTSALHARANALLFSSRESDREREKGVLRARRLIYFAKCTDLMGYICLCSHFVTA